MEFLRSPNERSMRQASSGEVVRVGDIIDAANRLEPLSASVARLIDLLADSDVDLRDIVEVISFDPLLKQPISGAGAPP